MRNRLEIYKDRNIRTIPVTRKNRQTSRYRALKPIILYVGVGVVGGGLFDFDDKI